MKRWVVKKDRLFADGMRNWVTSVKRAFVFRDDWAPRAGFRGGRAWAEAHASSFGSPKVRAVLLKPRKKVVKAKAKTKKKGAKRK